MLSPLIFFLSFNTAIEHDDHVRAAAEDENGARAEEHGSKFHIFLPIR